MVFKGFDPKPVWRICSVLPICELLRYAVVLEPRYENHTARTPSKREEQ